MNEAPRLPAENLADNCYIYMFKNCNKLASVNFSGNTIGPSCTLGWLGGVSTKGNFYYSYKLLNITRGEDGVPEGWEIIYKDSTTN